jgi:hypothetical protein
MNKYLKTYIRNRNIAIELNNKVLLHEVDYFEFDFRKSIGSLISSTDRFSIDNLYEKFKDEMILFINDVGVNSIVYGTNDILSKYIYNSLKSQIFISKFINDEESFDKLTLGGLFLILNYVESEILFIKIINKILNNDEFNTKYVMIIFSVILGILQDLLDTGYMEKNKEYYKNKVFNYTKKHKINKPPMLVKRINNFIKT